MDLALVQQPYTHENPSLADIRSRIIHVRLLQIQGNHVPCRHSGFFVKSPRTFLPKLGFTIPQTLGQITLHLINI